MNAEIGVIGGSGFYRLLDDAATVEVDTPYGSPSDQIAIGRVGERSVAFMPRHGSHHTIPPAAINYRANLWALHSLGVRRVIAPSAAGSLQPELKPGDIVVCDQFVDRTSGREDTYFNAGPEVAQSSAGLTVHDRGTVVIIQGPRFSTQAESRWFSSMGWHIVNMTQYPEVALARELEMCYVNLSLVTDYDAGLEGNPDVKPVSVQDVVALFGTNIEKLRGLVLELIPSIPEERKCPCTTAMRSAFIRG